MNVPPKLHDLVAPVQGRGQFQIRRDGIRSCDTELPDRATPLGRFHSEMASRTSPRPHPVGRRAARCLLCCYLRYFLPGRFLSPGPWEQKSLTAFPPTLNSLLSLFCLKQEGKKLHSLFLLLFLYLKYRITAFSR